MCCFLTYIERNTPPKQSFFPMMSSLFSIFICLLIAVAVTAACSIEAPSPVTSNYGAYPNASIIAGSCSVDGPSLLVGLSFSIMPAASGILTGASDRLEFFPNLLPGDAVYMNWTDAASGCNCTVVSCAIHSTNYLLFNASDNQVLSDWVWSRVSGAGSLVLVIPSRQAACRYQVDCIIGAPLGLVGPSGSYYSNVTRYAELGLGGANMLLGYNNGGNVASCVTQTPTESAIQTTAPVQTVTSAASTTPSPTTVVNALTTTSSSTTSAQATNNVTLSVSECQTSAEGSFAVLAGSAVTNVGTSLIKGNLGVSPSNTVTGFPPGIVVSGTIVAGGAVAANAQQLLTVAYDTVMGLSSTQTVPSADIGGQSFFAGVYHLQSALQLTGTVTLDGGNDPESIFVFQIGSSLTTASSSSVVLINGARACNVFWQVGSSAALGTFSSFKGNILALTSITINTGTTVEGRVLARNGAVTLDSNVIDNVCMCASLQTSVDNLLSFTAKSEATVTSSMATPMIAVLFSFYLMFAL